MNTELKQKLNLEERVKLQLSYIKLAKDFKSLTAQVSHDLASPLGYLKFSSEILESQIEQNYSEALEETARVIASSTSKLNDEAKAIVRNARTKVETACPKTIDLGSLFRSSASRVYDSKFQIETESPILIAQDAVYDYMFITLLRALKPKSEPQKKIHIEIISKKIAIVFEFENLTEKELVATSKHLEKAKEISLYNKCYSTLDGVLECNQKKKQIVITLDYF